MPTPKRLFIVEDEGIVAADLQDRLTSMGYAVVGKATSGEEAVQKIASSKPDLVLMDIILEGSMDGIQAAEAIKQQHPIPVIIFLTAHADDATMRRAAELGPFGYVLKPFDERELHVAIEIGLYRNGVETKLRELNRQLQEALDHVKTLRGLLPICAFCHKIRNADGSWERLESYIVSRTEADFTHGFCPECCEKHYGVKMPSQPPLQK